MHCKHPIHPVGGVMKYAIYVHDFSINFRYVEALALFRPYRMLSHRPLLARIRLSAASVFSFSSAFLFSNRPFPYATLWATRAHWNHRSDSTTFVEFTRIRGHSTRLHINESGRPTSGEKWRWRTSQGFIQINSESNAGSTIGRSIA